ncbi:MAG: cbb3-type cytochrome c oxidase subunit 3 [Alphaproteobacteria bacterium]
MQYENVVSFAATYGLIYFIILFAVVVAYALWPSNKSKFDRAARLPLEED